MTYQPSPRAERVWLRLSVWYGSRLGDEYGSVIPEEWAAVVDDATDDQVRRALARIKHRHVKYPPTFPEFEAAFPQKETPGAGAAVVSRLADHAIRYGDLCQHQRAAPWSYFGPLENFERGSGATVKHVSIQGVQIQACGICPRDARRITVDDLRREEAA